MESTPSSAYKIRALVAAGEQSLAEGPHPERARLDSEALLLHVLRRNGEERNRAWLIAHWNSPVTPAVGQEHRALVRRRFAGEPIQYITGEAEFYGLPFRVTPDVLIPRPETEHLVERALELAGTCTQPRILEVGTGSGAIAVAVADALPHAAVTSVDISPRALNIARGNARRNGVTVRFLEGDLVAPVVGEQFEMVVSNPPYIPATDKPTLAVEVREHEPALALFAGPDGLDVYRRLIPAAHTALVPGGWLLLEIGYGQSDAIRALLAAAGYISIGFTPDLQGIPRVACAQRSGL